MPRPHPHGTRILVLAIMLTATLTLTAQAGGLPQLQLSPDHAKVKVGQQVTVAVLVKEAPLTYGMDIRLVFDPQKLQVVDADKNVAGVQVQPGEFIDPAKSFSLQHQVDNATGAVDYALTLLNPAPAVRGNGRLLKVAFLAGAEGPTTIKITEGLFGLPNGEKVAPALGQVEIQILAKGGGASATAETPPASATMTPMGGAAVALLGLVALGIVGRRRWLRRGRPG